MDVVLPVDDNGLCVSSKYIHVKRSRERQYTDTVGLISAIMFAEIEE